MKRRKRVVVSGDAKLLSNFLFLLSKSGARSLCDVIVCSNKKVKERDLVEQIFLTEYDINRFVSYIVKNRIRLNFLDACATSLSFFFDELFFKHNFDAVIYFYDGDLEEFRKVYNKSLPCNITLYLVLPSFEGSNVILEMGHDEMQELDFIDNTLPKYPTLNYFLEDILEISAKLIKELKTLY